MICTHNIMQLFYKIVQAIITLLSYWLSNCVPVSLKTLLQIIIILLSTTWSVITKVKDLES